MSQLVYLDVWYIDAVLTQHQVEATMQYISSCHEQSYHLSSTCS